MCLLIEVDCPDDRVQVPLRVPAGSAGVEVLLDQEVEVTLKVVRPDGRPKTALIEIRDSDIPRLWTDANGIARISGLRRSGSYAVLVDPCHYTLEPVLLERWTPRDTTVRVPAVRTEEGR